MLYTTRHVAIADRSRSAVLRVEYTRVQNVIVSYYVKLLTRLLTQNTAEAAAGLQPISPHCHR